MNVYFAARNYIKEESFEYLIKVLKVSAVFSFIDTDDMSESLKKQLGTKLTHYKRYLKKGDDVDVFIKKCVTYITSLAVRTHTVNGRLEQVDLDSFKDSKYNNPIHNLIHTEDKNVLIISDMYERYLSDSLTVPIFHSIVKEVEYTSKNDYKDVLYVDTSREIASYVFNRLRKLLDDDKYRDRICFYRLGNNKEELFFQKTWGVPISKMPNGRIVHRRFYKYIIKELNTLFPEQFPCVHKGDKSYYTSFYNKGQIQQEYDSSQPEPDNDNDPYDGYGSYENWALMEAYGGDPSLKWNND